MKYTPKLSFYYDEGPERGVRLGHLIDQEAPEA
jgi:ribosome-binding factor A